MKCKPFTTGDLAKMLNCRIEGRSDLVINGANTIEGAGEDELTFLANKLYRKHLPNCKAGAIIMSGEELLPEDVTGLITDNPYEAFRQAIDILYDKEEPDLPKGIHETAAIAPTAVIGRDASVGAHVQIEAGAILGDRCVIYAGTYIGNDCVIGDDCILGVNVSLRYEVRIGSRVKIGDGTVVGYDGFGYVPGRDGYSRIKPVGTVEICDDVHLGANCCIDRATVGVTRIGKGTKLDNFIQVAHGVEIGEQTVIAAQTGISGSTRIGSWVMIGGQVGFVGHLEVGDEMKIGAQAGVTKSINSKTLVTGNPARNHLEMRRIDASLSRLPDLIRRVRKIEQELEKN